MIIIDGFKYKEVADLMNLSLKTIENQMILATKFVFLAQYFMSEEDLATYVKDAAVNTDDHPMVEFSKVINIAPVLEVMKDLREHDTDYDALITDIKSKDKKQEIKKKINHYSVYIRNIMNEVIEKVIYYEKENI